MFRVSEYHELISGRRRGAGAAAARAMLRALEVPYTCAVRWRNRRYDTGRARVSRADVPIISVGNLTLGGTGKTPMVHWLARHLRQRGLRVAIVSRGYRARHGQQNDEALELAQWLPDVPHVQDADRVAAVARTVAEFGAQVVVLDDGFQHRRLARDVDIVLLDALEPFGYEHVFPRGTLREPLEGLRRANVVCLSRADAVSADERESVRRRVAHVAPRAVWCEVAHRASHLVDAAGETQPLSLLDRRRVAAFCGIGNPAGFRHTLTTLGCEVIAWRSFPDHHAYSAGDLPVLTQLAAGAELVVCTKKDLVKLRRTELDGVRLWAVAIEMQFLSGQEKFEARVAGTLGAS